VSSTFLARRLESWPLERLRPYDRNPRTHSEEQVEQIVASIREFGFNNPILVDSEDGIIAGHGRFLAAQRMGLETVPVVVLDHLTPAQRRAYLLADNQIAARAGWDDLLLSEELKALQEDEIDLTLLGFSDEELSSLLDAYPDMDPGDAALDEDVPEVQPHPVSKPGDLWVLGEHRVLCGDSTKREDVQRVLDGHAADLVFTDPPYNVAYVGKTSESLTIQNDAQSPEEFREFLDNVLVQMREALKPGGVFYICAPAGPDETVFRNAIQDIFQLRQCLVWVKDVFVMGRQDYHWRHESILYGWKDGAAHFFLDDRTQDTVWEVPRPKASREHPTMKPVELVQRAIRNSSLRGEHVLDLFGGSGTTLVASETTSRKAHLIELDPRYVDVIVRRWERVTGREALLEDSGESFKELEAKGMALN